MEKEKVVMGCRADTEDKKRGMGQVRSAERKRKQRGRTTEKEGDLENNRGRGTGRKNQKN